MKKLLLILLLLSSFTWCENIQQGEEMKIYDFNVSTIDGQATNLKKYKGKVMLIVNVASKCGFTPQYEGLETLYKKHGEEGLAILGFPCNQFLSQEPENEGKIKIFCTTTYDVTFDMFSKIDVNGEHTHPLYVYLKNKAKGMLGTDSIKWNFTKFLINRKGEVVKRYGSNTTPEDIEKDIVALLKQEL
jgi:glutathione peroxidase